MWRMVVLVGFVMSADARGGTVVTTDGARHEGATSLVAGNAVAVKDAKGATASIPLAKVASATFDPPASAAAVAVHDRVAEWTTSDVGAMGSNGRVDVDAATGRVTLHDWAKGIRVRRGVQDSFFFAHQAARGDVTLVARLRVTDENRSARAGLMVRASLAPDAAFAMLARNGPEGRSAIVRRTTAGEECDETCRSERAIQGATWLKLERRGYTVAGHESTDGQQWTPVGEVQVPTDDEVLVGLFAATTTTSGGRSVFDKVSVTAGGGGGAAAPAGRLPRGIVTRGGSVLACDVTAADATTVEFTAADGARQSIPANRVARLVFTPLPAAHADKLREATAAGVMMINGDFLDGHVEGVADGRVRVTSVLFGMKAVDVKREAAAVVLRPAGAAAAAFEVRLANGSVLRAKGVDVTKDGVAVEDADLGKMTVRTADVVEVRRAG